MIQPIMGLGCSPVLVRGSKKVFLKWTGRALRQKRIDFPESNGPVCWSLAGSFFRVGDNDATQGSSEGSSAAKFRSVEVAP